METKEFNELKRKYLKYHCVTLRKDPAHQRGHEPEESFVCSFRSLQDMQWVDLYVWSHPAEVYISLRFSGEGSDYASPSPENIINPCGHSVNYRTVKDILDCHPTMRFGVTYCPRSHF
jgi:hypothetical protein